ncbi:unnamed protein product, partial [Arabidopsis halleri]
VARSWLFSHGFSTVLVREQIFTSLSSQKRGKYRHL